MTMGTQRTYSKLRASAMGLLLIHLVLRTISPNPTTLSDLYIFNSVAFLTAIIAFFSPNFNDRLARLSIGWALLLWAIGSTITTWNDFYTPAFLPNASDICYALFYPLILFGLIR